MNHSEVLTEIEDRLCDLEFAAFKREWYKETPSTTRKATPNVAPANKGSWSLHVSTQLDGKKQFRMQSEAGIWSTLPADRSQWPKEIRETQEKYEEFSKRRRTPGGYSTSMAGGTCEIV